MDGQAVSGFVQRGLVKGELVKRGLVKRLAALGLVALGLVAAGLPAARAEEDTTVNRRTAPGKEVLVRGHVSWDTSCLATPDVQVRVTTPPVNGRAEVRPGKIVAGAPVRGSTNCSGREMDGLQVYYTPNPGFLGVEQFQYTVDYGKLHAPRKVSVTIRVG